ncbi:MAG: Ig-like domain-containing protein [Clostridiales bacterium]|jgi:hypothetical protein|nr:Ig-like domain-containing protein [Clostridiales bacterium]
MMNKILRRGRKTPRGGLLRAALYLGVITAVSLGILSAAAIAASDVVFDDDFSNWAGISNMYTPGGTLTLSQEGGRLKAAMSGNGNFRRNLPAAIHSVKVVVEIEFEISVSPVKIYSNLFPGIGKTDWSFAIQPMILDSVSYLTGYNGSGIRHTLEAGRRYREIVTVDYDTLTTSFYLGDADSGEELISESRGNAANHEFQAVIFMINNTDSSVPQAVYFDKLRVTKTLPLEVVSLTAVPGGETISDGDTVSADAQFQLRFSEDVNPATVSGVTISPEPSEYAVGADADDASAVSVLLPRGLEYDTTYTITVPTSVAGVSGSSLGAARTFTFTTEPEPDLLVEIIEDSIKFTDFDGNAISAFPANGKIAVELGVRSLIRIPSVEKDVFVILAFSGGDGVLVDVVFLRAAIGWRDEQTLSVGFTLNGIADGLHCDLLVWDGMPGSPYREKDIFPSD